jgi:hypothetical protein
MDVIYRNSPRSRHRGRHGIDSALTAVCLREQDQSVVRAGATPALGDRPGHRESRHRSLERIRRNYDSSAHVP